MDDATLELIKQYYDQLKKAMEMINVSDKQDITFIISTFFTNDEIKNIHKVLKEVVTKLDNAYGKEK
jgi:hypothetical protein